MHVMMFGRRRAMMMRRQGRDSETACSPPVCRRVFEVGNGGNYMWLFL
jgi:hypothetical protein